MYLDGHKIIKFVYLRWNLSKSEIGKTYLNRAPSAFSKKGHLNVDHVLYYERLFDLENKQSAASIKQDNESDLLEALECFCNSKNCIDSAILINEKRKKNSSYKDIILEVLRMANTHKTKGETKPKIYTQTKNDSGIYFDYEVDSQILKLKQVATRMEKASGDLNDMFSLGNIDAFIIEIKKAITLGSDLNGISGELHDFIDKLKLYSEKWELYSNQYSEYNQEYIDFFNKIFRDIKHAIFNYFLFRKQYLKLAIADLESDYPPSEGMVLVFKRMIDVWGVMEFLADEPDYPSDINSYIETINFNFKPYFETSKNSDTYKKILDFSYLLDNYSKSFALSQFNVMDQGAYEKYSCDFNNQLRDLYSEIFGNQL